MRGHQVVVSPQGRTATTLRGWRAQVFLEDVESRDPQEVMARLTGNYRRGNERQARSHPLDLIAELTQQTTERLDN